MSTANPTIQDIREEIREHINAPVILEAHRSKKKIYAKSGILKEAYSNIFIVELEEAVGKDYRLSFSYTDLMTRNIRLTLLREDGMEDPSVFNYEFE